MDAYLLESQRPVWLSLRIWKPKNKTDPGCGTSLTLKGWKFPGASVALVYTEKITRWSLISTGSVNCERLV